MTSQTAAHEAVRLRPGRPEDAEACGRLCYDAFSTIARRHGFPPDFPSSEVAVGAIRTLFTHPGFYRVVAVSEGRIVGSNFLDERSPIAGVGPITVDPQVQDKGIGRRLMDAVIERAQQRDFPGIRLLQSAYHGRSLALYARLGFQARESVACMQGPALNAVFPEHHVRKADEGDLQACNRLCTAVHGHHRSGELADGIRQGKARLVEFDGRVTGYAADLAFYAHAVGETNRDLMALIGAAPAFGGPGILVPIRNGDLFGWCLDNGLRVVQVMTLMTMGLYNEPNGAYLPSIHF